MTDVKAVRVHETGGPEALVYESVRLPDPGPGEVQVGHRAIGVNFIDTYHRSGLYPLELPSAIGMEASGVVEKVGDGVEAFRPGDRVAYGAGPPGGYAEARNIGVERVVELPDEIEHRQAAAIMLKGMTVEYLLRRTFEVEAGMDVLWQAAAGGVGLIACQWLNEIGARVFGTVSTDEKAERARGAGCDHPIKYTEQDFVERVLELTDGEGVHVAYDGVGKSTFRGSLDCLGRRGMLVSFGNASGAPEPIEPLELSRGGSLYLTRPSLMDYVATRAEMEESAGALFDVVRGGAVEPEVGQTWALEEASKAHRALENRETTGSTILLP